MVILDLYLMDDRGYTTLFNYTSTIHNHVNHQIQSDITTIFQT